MNVKKNEVQKNWFGMEIHPSDCLISDATAGGKDKRAVINQVRADWDFLVTSIVHRDALDRLLERQYDVAKADVMEDMDEAAFGDKVEVAKG